MRKIFTFLLTCAFATSLSAQNFMKFDAIDGSGVKALNGLAHRTGAGQMEILVPTNFDLTNVAVDYQIAETDELLSAMPTNFSSPQKVNLKSPTSTKEWTITFKKVKPSALPIELNFSATNLSSDWTADTEGWAGASIDPAQNKVVRFSNVTTAFVTAFSDAPKAVTYKIFSVGATAFTGIFDVFTSADGNTWDTAEQFNTTNPMATGSAQEYSLTLAPSVRYIKWVYTERAGTNVTLNNILVEKAEGTSIDNETSEANQMYVNNNELFVSDNSSIAKLEVFNLIGTQVYSVKQPNNVTNLSTLSQGIYIAKATSIDGATSTLKFAVK